MTDGAKPKRRSRAPLVAGLIGCALLAALALAAFLKGSSTDIDERNPETVAEGMVCQILERDAHHHPVRCALVVDAPSEEVSALVRDYERFPETFDSELGSITLAHITEEPERVVHLEGVVETPLFTWPIDVRVRHEDLPDGVRTARWEQSEGAELVNRGRWVVRPVAEGTLLVYELEVRTPWVPNFLVNDFLLTQLAYPLTKVAEHVGAR